MKKLLFLACIFSLKLSAQKVTTIPNGDKKLMVADMTQAAGRIMWGGYEQIGRAAQSETDGAANTKAIVTAVGKNSGFDGKPYAAKVCDSLVLDGHDDWYLPCKDETVAIYQNFKTIGLDEKMTLWSSTEANGTQAITMYLYSGAFYNVQKVDINHFVCVRKAN